MCHMSPIKLFAFGTFFNCKFAMWFFSTLMSHSHICDHDRWQQQQQQPPQQQQTKTSKIYAKWFFSKRSLFIIMIYIIIIIEWL